jgi:tetratricopeptide (TPR) repeat protein
MSNEIIDAQIGQAWRYQREGNVKAALAEYERILKLNDSNIDANYGMGLTQRLAGDKEKAIQYFRRALELVEKGDSVGKAAREVAANTPGERIKPNTVEDDRYMMLTRMINQRLEELGAKQAV